MKALLEYLATNLVDHPEAVTIKERTGRHTVTYQLTVAPDETGKGYRAQRAGRQSYP
jgi:predicted RNA-binding protein YlqC (UPF0109 family)